MQGWAWSRIRVLFGHQSVGQNLLDGLAERRAEGAVVPRIETLDRIAADEGPWLASVRLGQNGSPQSKWRHLEQVLARADVTCIDLVLTKLCYVDVLDEAQVGPLFAEYRACMEVLQSRYPRLLFGHVTVPLRVAPHGWRYALQRPIRGVAPEVRRNAARDAFNALLRDAYERSGLLFDLANVESCDARGAAVVSLHGNVKVPALAKEWSDDGGHLNARGRKVVGRSFIDFLRSVEARYVASK
jgi:hypothetical protein